MALRCPNRLLTAARGPNWSLTGYLDQAGASRGILKPIWHCWDHFRSLPIWLCPFQNLILVCKHLSPLISHKNGSVFKIYIWISVFRRKKPFENPMLGCRDICKINTGPFFFKHPVSFCQSSWQLLSSPFYPGNPNQKCHFISINPIKNVYFIPGQNKSIFFGKNS